MRLLKDILYKTGILEVKGPTQLAISAVTANSRDIKKDGLFVAIRGTQNDGHQFIQQAISQGAAAVVCEEFPENAEAHVTYIRVGHSDEALSTIACNFFENPSEKIKLVGVTGTNGKTTIATLLYELFEGLGYTAGLISTVRNRIHKEEVPSTHTTPDPVKLNELLSKMVQAGCQYVFMEVSSHALVQKRTHGLHFTGAVFTNITRDHLDYHKTFQEYIKAKKIFFDKLSREAFALVNSDDSNGLVMVQNCEGKKYTFSIHSNADYKCKILESQLHGLLLNINGKEVWVKLIGAFNAYNVLAVFATAHLLKQEPQNVLTALSLLNPVEGRFQYIRSENGILGIVDYAHTPDALENILKAVKDIQIGNESIITVIGCGGDRDAGKRPIMARIAAENSSYVILTSDNPRSENPEAILDEMQKGVENFEREKIFNLVNRKDAIGKACAMAKKGDIIVVAGKGHEKYQEINGVKHPFDDLEILKNCLNLKIN